MILKDLRVHSVGWLDAARALYQGTIVPTLTYLSIAWVRMNKAQREQLGKVQKVCIYELLGLQESATYAAVLLDAENKPSRMTVRLWRKFISQMIITG